MKKIATFFALLFIADTAHSQDSLLNKSSSFNLFTSKDLVADFKFIDPTKGSFGIDYKLSLERKLFSLNPNTTKILKNVNLNLNSKGFITVAGDKNPINSIISEVKFEAFPLFYAEAEALTIPQKNWRQAVNDPNLILEAQELAKRVSAPFWLFLNLHAKHEGTQDFKNYDFALGSTLNISTSFLTAILDFPFGILRVEKDNGPRQLDLSMGYDYVTNVKNTALAEANNNENYLNRLNFHAEWETGVLTARDRIIFYFDSYHNLKPTQKLKDDKKVDNYFYMIKLDHIIGFDEKSRTISKISLKYTRGALPPNFNTGYVLGGGYSLEF